MKITRAFLRSMLERQEYRCALSGRKLTPDTATLDHMLALARGGLHDGRNAQIVDRTINAAKGTMTNDEFIAMCCDVADISRGLRTT